MDAANISQTLTSVNHNIEGRPAGTQPEQPGLGWGFSGECYDGSPKKNSPAQEAADKAFRSAYFAVEKTIPNGITKRVYESVGWYASLGTERLCFASLAAFVERTGFSRRTVQRRLRWLHENHYLVQYEEGRGRSRFSVYRLTIDGILNDPLTKLYLEGEGIAEKEKKAGIGEKVSESHLLDGEKVSESHPEEGTLENKDQNLPKVGKVREAHFSQEKKTCFERKVRPN